jgi:hypothetical protein
MEGCDNMALSPLPFVSLALAYCSILEATRQVRYLDGLKDRRTSEE